MTSLAAERQIPVLHRLSVRYAAVGALVGIALSLFVAFAVFDIGIYREAARPIQASAIGQTFGMGFGATPDVTVTVLSGTRSVYRQFAFVELELRYVAAGLEIVSAFNWHAHAGDVEPSFAATVSRDPWVLQAGDTAEGWVSFSGLPAGETVTITYQEPSDAAPRYVLVVEPTR